MNRKLKNIFKFAALFLFAAFIIFAAAASYKYYQVAKAAGGVKTVATSLLPKDKIKLGDLVRFDIIQECPWNIHPVSAEADSGKGTQVAGKPEIRISKIKWGEWEWRISTEIQPFAVGDIEKGRVLVTVNRALPAGGRQCEYQIPAFKAGALDTMNDQELAVAGRIEKSPKSQIFRIALSAFILISLLIAALYYFFFRKRLKAAIVLTPWEFALLELCELRAGFMKDALNAQLCVARLTDIVRNYLEKRFSIHAPAQTTSEFLRDLNRESSPLEVGHREFLGNFLQAADLVKFANLPVDKEVLENALVKAEELVKSTTPSEKQAAVSKR